LRNRRTQAADADDERMRCRELRLRIRPEFLEQVVAAVAE
jgi:hypothetical protein